MRKSELLKAEVAFVEREIGQRVICSRCGARLESYASFCTADLSEACPGFEAIEQARRKFKETSNG
jgi:ribosomal protein L40E